jgi:hypothetical protein
MMKALLFPFALAGTLSADAATMVHVSPAGADTNPGTEARPFASLVRARDEIRRLRAETGASWGGAVVVLAPGRYVLREALTLSGPDSGAGDAPVVYRAAEPGTAVVSGGLVLSGWRRVIESDVPVPLAPAARDHVVYADIAPEILSSIPGFANGGCGFKGGTPEYPIALYQGNDRLPVSRWPNEGFVKTGECLGKTRDWGRGITATEGIFRFDDARLARWAGEPDLWFDGLWYHPWADQKMQLKSIDLEAKSIALADPESHAYGFQEGQDFFAFNAIGEIDRPGEWAVDREKHRIYLWPKADPATSPVTVSVCPTLVSVDRASNIRFEGLVLEHSIQTAVRIRGGKAVTLSGSTLRHTGSWGVEIDGGSDCTVMGCDLYDLGEGGVRASGGVRKTLTPGKHLIENNHIHHFGRFVNTYRPGAAVYGVGNAIRHNLIHHAQHQALFFNGNDHLIEYNIIHDVCLHTSDAGAIYACGRDWSQQGCVIRNNLIHTTGRGTDGCGSHGIYMDDSTSGVTIEQNIVVDVGVGITTCGLSNHVQNNLAVNTRKPAFQISSRGIDSFAKANAMKGRESSLFRKFLADEALFRTDLWRRRYPELLAVLDMDPLAAHDSHFNVLRNNVNVGGVPASVANAEKIGRTSTIEKNVNLYGDPGFVDLQGFDLRLRSDARVFEKVPGFVAPDFEKMGLYADSRRASPAVKFGAGVSPMPEIQPRIPRPEMRPRYAMQVVTGAPFTADGSGEPPEWPSTRSPQLECVNPIHQAPSKHMCRGRFAFDGAAVRFLITVEVDAQKPLVTDAKWGMRDGIELAVSGTEEDAPVILLHLYPDGTYEVVSPGAGGAGTAEALREAFRYGARAEDGAWTAEGAIPLASLGIEPAAFRELRFNMNVRRMCDETWTCWWTVENGITDLLSSGLLILPRQMPPTDEMTRRRAAAASLFESEAAGALHWQLLKPWTVTADPDRLGPVGQPQDAPSVSFGTYAGWAVARHSVDVTAEQASAAVCFLFIPCIDEEGDVYVNGERVLSHTAASTGIAPGILWRQPVLVDLKAAGISSGTLSVAVHLRGNMGTGGLRKGAFLIWGSRTATAEQLYDFLSENPKLGGHDRVPPFWQDFERERIPPIPPASGEADFGRRIQRTMELLATSGPQRRNRVRILFYGQSITQGMHSREMINVLRSRFPWAIIDFENRAIGGFGASSLVRTGEHDLYPRDADLLIFHVYGDAASLDTIFGNVRRRNSSDILVYTHHYNWISQPEALRERIASLGRSTEEWHALAEKYNMELAPVYRDWPLYFRKHDWGLNEVMGDTVHSNVHHNAVGHTLLAKLVLRNFRYHVGNPVNYPDAVRRVEPGAGDVTLTGEWQRAEDGVRTREEGARLKLTFEGNRIDILPLATSAPGTARILVDGRPPAEFRELYAITRPSEGPYIWMPALKRVDFGPDVLPRVEDWTLTPFDVDLSAKKLSFTLEGSLTGPDGQGERNKEFVSESGRIVLHPGDFNIIWPCTYRKQEALPEGYKVSWRVRPLFVDPWRPAANVDESFERAVTLVKGLPFGRHTLEIVANGDGEVPVKAILVRRPPFAGAASD